MHKKRIYGSKGPFYHTAIFREIMKSLLLATFIVLLSSGAFATEATDLRAKGVQAASNGNFIEAQKYLSQSAKLGYYTAQVEYAYLLESSPDNVQNRPESYAWFNVVVARKGTDTEFAKEGLSRLSKAMSSSETQKAKELTKKYLEQYAK